MAQKRIVIVCGEASGDLNAASLVSSMLQQNPDIKFFAVGGEKLRQAGAEIFYDIKGLSVLGLFDALKSLPKFFALQKAILEKIKTLNADAIILVDFSGFNLRLAKKINKSIPAIYYISPQIWASRSGRIKQIKKFISKMVVLFKFEEGFYKKFGVTAECAGHPLLDIVKPGMPKKELLNTLGFQEDKTTIALLPGSRKAEIEMILPIMLSAAELIDKEIAAQFVIAKSSQVDWKLYDEKIKNQKSKIKIVEGKTYDCLNIADFALVASGTATLETALMQTPFCVVYKIGLLNYLLYRPQIKVPFIGMVNIVAGRQIVPEFIQYSASAKKISSKVLDILKNPSAITKMKQELCAIQPALGEKGASARASRIILDFLKF